MIRFKEHYLNVVRKDLLTKFNYKNLHQIPKLEKIVINISVKEAVQNSKNVVPALIALELITGQKAVLTKAKKSIAGFKLRKNVELGAKITLRNDTMYTFFDRFVTIVLPRIGSFKGFSKKSFDKRGNCAFGIQDFFVFYEIENLFALFDKTLGMDIIFVTTAKTDLEAKILLNSFKIPFKN
jgi:large subunit ribosomal protein L5